MIEIRQGDRLDDYLTVTTQADSREQAIAFCDEVAQRYYTGYAEENPMAWLNRYISATHKGKQFEVSIDYSPNIPKPVNDSAVT